MAHLVVRAFDLERLYVRGKGALLLLLLIHKESDLGKPFFSQQVSKLFFLVKIYVELGLARLRSRGRLLVLERTDEFAF
jgi:hypothetical protein